MGSVAQQGGSHAIAGAFTTLLNGRVCFCWNRGWEARWTDLAGAFAPRSFFGGFSSAGIPTSSYFPAAPNGGWEARRPDLAGKFARTKGWEARRPDLADAFAPSPCC